MIVHSLLSKNSLSLFPQKKEKREQSKNPCLGIFLQIDISRAPNNNSYRYGEVWGGKDTCSLTPNKECKTYKNKYPWKSNKQKLTGKSKSLYLNWYLIHLICRSWNQILWLTNTLWRELEGAKSWAFVQLVSSLWAWASLWAGLPLLPPPTGVYFNAEPVKPKVNTNIYSAHIQMAQLTSRKKYIVFNRPEKTPRRSHLRIKKSLYRFCTWKQEFTQGTSI